MTEFKNDILAEADKIINGERNEQYGEAEDNFEAIARLWSAYLGAKSGLSGHDVAMLMILLKIARTNGRKKKDNYVDICGYAALAAKL
jgi:uncharacterized protein DUF6378